MQEHKKESFFKNLFGGISKKTQKNSKKTKKSVDNFDSGIDFIKGLIFEKNRKKSLSIIAKIRKIEENNISLILKKSKDNEKEDIKRIYSEKISILDSFEKSIKDSIIKEKDEKKLKDQNQKLTYINNRLDFYVKNKQYDKAKDALKTFYEKNKNDESVEIFYNNKNKELEESLKEKVGFFGNLFNKKKEIPESEKKEEVVKEVKEDIKEIKEEIKKEIKEEKIEEPLQEEIKQEELKEEELEKEQEKIKKEGFFGKFFSKKKEIKELEEKELVEEEKNLDIKQEEVKEEIIEEKIEEPVQEEIKEEIEEIKEIKEEIEEPLQEEIKQEELKEEELEKEQEKIKKEGFFGKFFSKKKEIQELEEKELVEKEKKLDIKQEEVKEEIIEEKIEEQVQEKIKEEIEEPLQEEPLQEEIKQDELKEEELEKEQEKIKKEGFFGKFFSKKKEIKELEEKELVEEEKNLDIKQEEVKEEIIEEKTEETVQEEIKEEIEEPLQEEIKQDEQKEEEFEIEEEKPKKEGFFGKFFSKKKEIQELEEKELVEEEKKLDIKQEEVKEEIIEEKIEEQVQEKIKEEIKEIKEIKEEIEEPLQEEIKQEEAKEEKLEIEQEKPKKEGFFGKFFSKKKEIPELDKSEILLEDQILETKEIDLEATKPIEIKEEIQEPIQEEKIKESVQEEIKQEEPKKVNNIRIGNQIKENEKIIIEEKKESLEINNNQEKQELESEKKEERKLGISALRKDTIEEKKVIISLQKKIENVQNIDTDEGNKLGVEKISEIKNEENDEAIINNENKENINGFFNKFFSKDNQNFDKVVGLMDSVMKINDLDKAISTVETVKNSEGKNLVIQDENNKAIGIQGNTEVVNNTNLITQNIEPINSEVKQEDNNTVQIPNLTENQENIDKQNVITEDAEIINTVIKKEEESFISSIFGGSKEEAKPEKKIKLEEIKDYYGAMKSIDYFIHIKDWDKAKSGLEEVKSKEEAAFNKLYDKIDIEKERNKQKELYYKKLLKIEKMTSYLENEEIIYNEKKEIEKAKIKLIKVKEKLDELIGSKKYYEALDLITSFFDENKNSVVIINFFNKWKNIIQKKIKKYEKQKEKEISSNVKKEAEILIGENINLGNENINKIDGTKRKLSFFRRLLEKLNLYKKIKLNLKEKRLMDEVTLLIESQNEVDELARRSRLENIHMGLVKELDNDNLLGYELYAKILGRDKISGDTFGFIEDNKNYKFFLGDATGHGLQAGLIVTLLTRLFYNFSKDNFLEKIVYEVNNGLKQDLKSGNFITGIFFEVDKNNLDSIKYVGMGHEPMLIFRKKTMEIEKYIAGGLAAGIRIINDINNIKTHNIKLSDGDIVFIYSDGIVESRNKDNILLGIEGLASILKKVCIKYSELKITDMYTSIMEEIRTYRGGSTNFYDDATMFILKRNTNKDIMDKKSRYLKDLSIKEGLSRANIKELEGKTKEEIEKKLEKIRKEKQLSLILGNLDKLYLTGEILKLKQESIRYIKEGFIHKKINRFLKKAIQNERKYKIDLKDQKMKSKYSVLKELLKKGSYTTVINECNEIIAGDGNITI